MMYERKEATPSISLARFTGIFGKAIKISCNAEQVEMAERSTFE